MASRSLQWFRIKLKKWKNGRGGSKRTFSSLFLVGNEKVVLPEWQNQLSLGPLSTVPGAATCMQVLFTSGTSWVCVFITCNSFPTDGSKVFWSRQLAYYYNFLTDWCRISWGKKFFLFLWWPHTGEVPCPQLNIPTPRSWIQQLLVVSSWELLEGSDSSPPAEGW